MQASQNTKLIDKGGVENSGFDDVSPRAPRPHGVCCEISRDRGGGASLGVPPKIGGAYYVRSMRMLQCVCVASHRQDKKACARAS